MDRDSEQTETEHTDSQHIDAAPEVHNSTHPDDPGSNATGSQSDSAVTWDVVDSGQSDDIESPLTAQGVSGRETTRETSRNESDERGHEE